jgi:aminopeptidase YwaD
MKTLLVIIATFFYLFTNAQNIDYAKSIVSELSSEKYHGRGYYKKGDVKASKYLAKELKKYCNSFNGNYYQDFSFPVNTFPGKMEIEYGEQLLYPGKDYVVREYSSGKKGNYSIYYLDSASFDMEAAKKDIAKFEAKTYFLAADYKFYFQFKDELAEIYELNPAGAIMFFDPPIRYYKAHSSFNKESTVIWIDKELKDTIIEAINLNIENEFIDKYDTRNVLGYIEGSACKDSFYVFTAHYDHLGRMGKKTYFPGANDNASGVAMLLNLAEYYSLPENQPKYSMCFIAFAGEETGLRGSQYYTENPLFPLEKIKYLINFDMIADNGDSIHTEYSEEGKSHFAQIESIAHKSHKELVFDVEELAGNSDHYPFALNNVPAVFFLTKGDYYSVYHTPFDTFENTDFTNYSKLFRTVTEFIKMESK